VEEPAHCLEYLAAIFVPLGKELVQLGGLIGRAIKAASRVWLSAQTVITAWLRSDARLVGFVVVYPRERFASLPGGKCSPGHYRAESTRLVVVPSFAMLRVPRSAKIGRVVGVAYLTLTVHVPPEASGVVNEQVVPVMLYSAPTWLRVSAVTCTGPPLAVTVTTLVTAARGDGMVNVRVRTPKAVARVPFVADVKVRVPGAIPVPVSVTGDPVGFASLV
jgi:hypothetical protein